MQAINILQDDGIPTHSYLAAIQHINSFEDKNAVQYAELISELIEVQYNESDTRLAKYTYLYLVQELLRHYNDPTSPPLRDILNMVTLKAKTFIADNEYIFANPEEVSSDVGSNPHKKKGSKQREALAIFANNRETKSRGEIIQMFMDDLNMTKAGANTYYCSTKKSYEEV